MCLHVVRTVIDLSLRSVRPHRRMDRKSTGGGASLISAFPGVWHTVEDVPVVSHDSSGWLGPEFGSAAAIGAPPLPAAIAAAVNRPQESSLSSIAPSRRFVSESQSDCPRFRMGSGTIQRPQAGTIAGGTVSATEPAVHFEGQTQFGDISWTRE